MAEFTEFNAPIGVAGPTSTRRATAEDFGGSGEGLVAAGKSIAAFSDMLTKRQEGAAALFREETIADDRLFAATRLQELKDTLPDGGSGAFDIMKRELEERTETNSALQTTDEAKEQYGLQAKRLQARVLSRAVGVEAVALAVGERRSFEKILDFNTNTVRADPSNETLAESIQQIDELISISRLTEKNKVKFRQEAIEDLRAAQVDGLLSPERIKSAEDAEQALARLETDEFKKSLPSKQYGIALARAQKLVKQYTNQEEVAFISDITLRLNEEATGLVPLDGSEVTDDELRLNITDPEKLNKAITLANTARRLGKYNRILAGATIDEIPAMQEELEQALATRGDQPFEIQQQKLLTATLNTLQAEANEADRDTVEGLKEPLEAIAANREGATIDQSVIDGIHDDDTREMAQNALDMAESQRSLREFTKTASKKELKAKQAELWAELAGTGGDDTGFFEAQENLKAFISAVKSRESAIDKDRAGYAAQTHPAVAHAIERYTEDPSFENFADLAEAQIGAQVSLGIDRRDVYILPADLVSQFKVEKSKVLGEPDAAKNVYKLIVQEQQRAGEKYWPQVMKQMRDAGAFSTTELVVAGMTSRQQIGPAQELLVAEALRAEGAFEGMPSGTKTAITTAVVNATAPLASTLNARGVTRGVTAFNEQKAAVETLATMYVRRYGMDATSAAQKAAKEVVMDNYDFSDTFRVPVSSQLPLDTAEAATQNTLASMNFDAIKIPRGLASPEDNKRQYADAVRNNGYWITNGDETGVQLVAPNGVIVETTDGKPVEMLWGLMRGHVAETFDVGSGS